MKWVHDPEILVWLENDWDGSLEWDTGNTEKLAKHNTSVDDVEEFFDGDFVLIGRILRPDELNWKEERYVVFGETLSGRWLTIVWTRRSNSIRPISCRSMRANEEKEYESRRRKKV